MSVTGIVKWVQRTDKFALLPSNVGAERRAQGGEAAL